MVERLQSLLHPLSSYVVLPVFALANAGVALGGIGDALTSSVALGIMAGLVLGKPLGILLASWIAVKLGLAKLPDRTTLADGARCRVRGRRRLHRVAVHRRPVVPRLADALTDDAKVGILVASVLAAALGVRVLMLATRGGVRKPTRRRPRRPSLRPRDI